MTFGTITIHIFGTIRPILTVRGGSMRDEEQLRHLLDKDYMPIIYRNIKRYRVESGISLMKIAEVLDVSYDYLRRIESENDLIKTCSLKLLIKLSIILDKPLDDFLKED